MSFAIKRQRDAMDCDPVESTERNDKKKTYNL